MNRVPYYLVCHETKSKLCVGDGAHRFDALIVTAPALEHFLADNALFVFRLETAHDDTTHYRDYTPPDNTLYEDLQETRRLIRQIRQALDDLEDLSTTTSP